MNKQRIETAAQATAIIRAVLPKVQNEERVFVLPLDSNGKVLAKPILVSVGHQDGTAEIDAGAIFREALKAGAEEIIVAHNHPSGDLTPSKADIEATKKLKAGAELVGLAQKSSAAQFLTYIASTGAGGEKYEIRYENENIWMSQKLLAAVYGVDKRTIHNRHWVQDKQRVRRTVPQVGQPDCQRVHDGGLGARTGQVHQVLEEGRTAKMRRRGDRCARKSPCRNRV